MGGVRGDDLASRCVYLPASAAAILPLLQPAASSSMACTLCCRCPEMTELLRHCGPQVFDGPLPWDGTV